MPPPKTLTRPTFEQLRARAGTRISDDKAAELAAQFRPLERFVPPQTYAAWLTATGVSGMIYGTKSRGDRLQAVDRAYKAWIEYGGPEGIAHGGNAENLRHALETYTGVIYRMTGKVSGFSHDYRNERNRGGVMTDTLALADLLTKLCLESPESDAEKRQNDRRALLSLIANIQLEWSPVATLIAGIAGTASNANALIEKGLAKDIVMICEGSVAAVGGAVGALVVDDIPGKIKAFLNDQWRKFKEWAANALRSHFGMAQAIGDVLEKAGQAFALVVKVALESIANVTSGAVQIFDGVKNLVADAWKRRMLTLEKAELVTSFGEFALIRNGIETGIRNRQIVAAWTIAKGVTKTTMSVTASAAAGKIADLVLGAFEFIFKLVYNLVEVDAIKKFIAEARTMWNHVQNLPNPLVPPAPPLQSGPPVHTVQPAFLVPKATTGSMPAFKAANYSTYDFLTDNKAAFLNFMHSLVKASPVLAAVVINTGTYQEIEDIMHAATPRSSADAKRAVKHIESLQIDAVRLYEDSGYKVVPNTTAMNDADNALFQSLLRGAQRVPAS